MSATTFGFQAALGDDDFGPGWTVSLPHQCDRWRIATDTTAVEAIQHLDDFIAQATATRDSIAAQAGEWANVEIAVRVATPIMPCRSGRHGFHTGDCEDVDALNGVLGGLYAAISPTRFTETAPPTFRGPRWPAAN